MIDRQQQQQQQQQQQTTIKQHTISKNSKRSVITILAT
jgi:hypothetical protein